MLLIFVSYTRKGKKPVTWNVCKDCIQVLLCQCCVTCLLEVGEGEARGAISTWNCCNECEVLMPVRDKRRYFLPSYFCVSVSLVGLILWPQLITPSLYGLLTYLQKGGRSSSNSSYGALFWEWEIFSSDDVSPKHHMHCQNCSFR